MKSQPKFTKVQELVYELRIRDAMTRDVVAVGPDMPLVELRELLRSKRIAGAPVLQGESLCGIISIEDLIKWMAEDGNKADCVRDRMTTSVDCLYDDEPLIHAIGRLESTGFGRFPVIDRHKKGLVGVITKRDVIETLLREIEIDYHEEEIHRYRASHIFEDVLADTVTLQFESYVKGKDFDRAGKASGELKKTLSRLGIHPQVVRRAAIASYEAEMNAVIYADGGTLAASVGKDQIHIEVTDVGPGIADIEQALQPGFSTASDWVRELGFGAGMGLTNIKRCADTMELKSTVGEGTHLSITINARRETDGQTREG